MRVLNQISIFSNALSITDNVAEGDTTQDRIINFLINVLAMSILSYIVSLMFDEEPVNVSFLPLNLGLTLI
jgi:hypothetical protein